MFQKLIYPDERSVKSGRLNMRGFEHKAGATTLRLGQVFIGISGTLSGSETLIPSNMANKFVFGQLNENFLPSEENILRLGGKK